MTPDSDGKIVSGIGALLHFFFVAFPKDLWRWLTLRRKDVAGQVIVITGGASGLGLKMAELFSLELSAKVVILDIDGEGAKRAVKQITELGGAARGWRCDVSNFEQMQSCAGEIISTYGRIDMVIANAAILHFAHFLQLSTEQLQSSLNVNVMGTLNTIRVFLGDMERRNKGHIVAMCSIAGFCGETYGMAYCPTKFAVRGIMDCLRMELRDRDLEGIACTTLCPYFVRTPMVLSKGIRPTSRLIPFMSVESCARRAVDAILKEKVLAFIPSWISTIPMFNALCSLRMQKTGREYLNCRYEPVASKAMQDGGCSTQASVDVLHANGIEKHNGSIEVKIAPGALNGCTNDMAGGASLTDPFRAKNDFFAHPPLLQSIFVPLGLLLTFLAWNDPALMKVWWLGPLGQLACYLGTNYNACMAAINILAWATHGAEAVYALYICDEAKLTHASALKWFLQTLLYGYFSMGLLLHYRKTSAKNRGKRRLKWNKS